MCEYHTQLICGWKLPSTEAFLSWCHLHQINPYELALDTSLFYDYFPKEVRGQSIVFTITCPYPFCKKEEDQWTIRLETSTFDAIRGLPPAIMDAMQTWIQEEVQKEYFTDSDTTMDPPACYVVLRIS